jgi:hypothetical protein
LPGLQTPAFPKSPERIFTVRRSHQHERSWRQKSINPSVTASGLSGSTLNCSRTFAEMRRLVSALSWSRSGESCSEIVHEPHAGQSVRVVAKMLPSGARTGPTVAALSHSRQPAPSLIDSLPFSRSSGTKDFCGDLSSRWACLSEPCDRGKQIAAPLGVDAEVRNRGLEESVGGFRDCPQTRGLDSGARPVGVTRTRSLRAVEGSHFAAGVTPCPGTQQSGGCSVREEENRAKRARAQEEKLMRDHLDSVAAPPYLGDAEENGR